MIRTAYWSILLPLVGNAGDARPPGVVEVAGRRARIHAVFIRSGGLRAAAAAHRAGRVGRAAAAAHRAEPATPVVMHHAVVAVPPAERLLLRVMLLLRVGRTAAAHAERLRVMPTAARLAIKLTVVDPLLPAAVAPRVTAAAVSSLLPIPLLITAIICRFQNLHK
jgi:hypothetical protein